MRGKKKERRKGREERKVGEKGGRRGEGKETMGRGQKWKQKRWRRGWRRDAITCKYVSSMWGTHTLHHSL